MTEPCTVLVTGQGSVTDQNKWWHEAEQLISLPKTGFYEQSWEVITGQTVCDVTHRLFSTFLPHTACNHDAKEQN